MGNKDQFWAYCKEGNLPEILNGNLDEYIEIEQRQEGFDIACREGNANIVKHLAERYCQLNYDEGMRLATKNAKVNIVTLLLSLSAKKNPNW